MNANNLYAGAIMATRKTERYTVAFYGWYSNHDEAVGAMTRRAKEHWPYADGYHTHAAVAIEIAGIWQEDTEEAKP